MMRPRSATRRHSRRCAASRRPRPRWWGAARGPGTDRDRRPARRAVGAGGRRWSSSCAKSSRTARAVEHPGGSAWSVRGNRHSVAATNTWGTAARVRSTSPQACWSSGRSGSPTRLRTAADPERDRDVAAQEKAAEMQERFAEWLWEDPEPGGALAPPLQRRFNASCCATTRGEDMQLPGLARSLHPAPHQPPRSPG